MKYIKKFEDNDIGTTILFNAIRSNKNYTRGNYDDAVYALDLDFNLNSEVYGKTALDFLIDRQVDGSGKYVNWEKSDLVKIAKLLIKSGAKFRDSDLLKMLKGIRNLRNTDEIDDANKIIKLMIKNDINLNITDHHGRNALMLAIDADTPHSFESNRFYELKIIEELIKNGISLIQPDDNGLYFIDYIKHHNKKPAKKLLLKIDEILLNNNNLENVNSWFLLKNAEKYNI